MANLDDHVHRILSTMFRFGLFDRPQGTVTPIDASGDGAVARAAAEAATVLLKNSGSVLPLRSSDSVALIGPGAATPVTGGGGSPGVAPLYAVSPLQVFPARGARVNYAQGMGPVDLGPQPALPTDTVTAEDGSPGWTARFYANTTWSGTPALTRDGTRVINNGGGFPGVTGSTTVHLEGGTQHAIRVDWAKPNGQAMIELAWTPPAGTPNVGIAQAVAAAKKSDVAVVFASNKDTEGIDRTSLALPGDQDALISAVAAANPHTVVVLDTGGPVTMPWLDRVAGVVEAWYPGEEDGNAAAAVLYGDVDPGGRLPITFPKSLADTPANTPAQYPGVNGVATYSEGLDVGYRHYDASGIEPLFPFGYGLSYTTFSVNNLSVYGPTVAVDVTNTGQRSGAQVVQVYVGGADGANPPRRLEGFAKVSLRPGEHRHVVVLLDAQAFAHWDTAAQSWVTPAGNYTVSAGTSSRDLPLSTQVSVR